MLKTKEKLLIEEIVKRIEALEEMAHPKCGIEGFDGYAELNNRIKKLEDEYNRRQ